MARLLRSYGKVQIRPVKIPVVVVTVSAAKRVILQPNGKSWFRGPIV